MAETPSFNALGFAFRVFADDGRLTDYLAELLDDLADFSAAHTHDYEFRMTSVHDRNSHCEVTLDGRRMFNAPAAEELISSLVRDINREAIEGCKQLALHAGGVGHDGVGVVFPGAMEAGKTTLVAGLVRAGMSYLTDEAVAIDAQTLRIRPYPKPLTLDEGSWSMFPELEPHAALPSDDYKLNQWQVPSSAIRANAVGRPCPIGFVVFPRYEPGAASALEPLRRAEALVELSKHTFEFEEQPRAALDVLAELVRPADCYRLTMGDLDGAVTLVANLAGFFHPQREAS